MSFDPAQSQAIESFIRQYLQEAHASIKQDIDGREERIFRRIEGERQEQLTSVFSLRRELLNQISGDLAALDDRISRRLDTERREQKGAIAEMRLEAGKIQDCRHQLSIFRCDVTAMQAAVARVNMNNKSSSDVHDSFGSVGSALEAAISDIRREVESLQEQLQLHTSTAEAYMESVRKELFDLKADEVRGLQEQLGRNTAELSRSILDVANSVGTKSNSSGSEWAREVQKLRSELEYERNQSEQQAGRLGLIEARNAASSRRLDELERKCEGSDRQFLDQTQRFQDASMSSRLDDLEAICKQAYAMALKSGSVAMPSGDLVEDTAKMRGMLEETRRIVYGAQEDMARLSQEVADQRLRSEAMEAAYKQSFKQPPNPLEDQLRNISAEFKLQVEQVESRLNHHLFRQIDAVEESCRGHYATLKASIHEARSDLDSLKQSPLTSQVLKDDFADNSSMHSCLPSSCSRCESVSGDGPTRRAGSAEHVALAACVGELDAELRLELKQSMTSLADVLRSEIKQQIAKIEGDVHRITGGPQAVLNLDARLGALEAVHIDKRLNALELSSKESAASSHVRNNAESCEINSLSGAPFKSSSATAKPEPVDDLTMTKRTSFSSTVSRPPDSARVSEAGSVDRASISETLDSIEARLDAKLDRKSDARTRDQKLPPPVKPSHNPEPQELTAAMVNAAEAAAVAPENNNVKARL